LWIQFSRHYQDQTKLNLTLKQKPPKPNQTIIITKKPINVSNSNNTLWLEDDNDNNNIIVIINEVSDFVINFDNSNNIRIGNKALGLDNNVCSNFLSFSSNRVVNLFSFFF